MDALYSVIDSLQSNPNETPVGKSITKAMIPLESGEEDWASILAACDLVNGSEQGPKDAIRAIRRKLQDKEDSVTLSMTMTVLESLVKNCGLRFHVELTNRAFLHELRQLLLESMKRVGGNDRLAQPTFAGSSNNSQPVGGVSLDSSAFDRVNSPSSTTGELTPGNVTAEALQKRILGNIQCWAYVFRSDPRFKPIKDLYDDLLSRNIPFPELGLSLCTIPSEAMQESLVDPAAISSQSPSRFPALQALRMRARNVMRNIGINVPSDPIDSLLSVPNQLSSPTQPYGQTRIMPGEVSFLTAGQLIKLKSEVSVVCEHMAIFKQMISHFVAAPRQPNNLSSQSTEPQGYREWGWLTDSVTLRPRDVALLDKVYEVCAEMHSRILNVIGLVNEDLLAQMLSLIDEINEVFAQYLDFKKAIKVQAATNTSSEGSVDFHEGCFAADANATVPKDENSTQSTMS